MHVQVPPQLAQFVLRFVAPRTAKTMARQLACNAFWPPPRQMPSYCRPNDQPPWPKGVLLLILGQPEQLLKTALVSSFGSASHVTDRHISSCIRSRTR